MMVKRMLASAALAVVTMIATIPATAQTAAQTDTGYNEPPELTEVSGHLVKGDGSSAANGAVYFVFQNRLNELPHDNPLDKIKSMTEAGAAVDGEGSFTLKMKPGNFAMVYDPAATGGAPQPGSDSMTTMKKLNPDQVKARIAAIKENAQKGMPIAQGKIGSAYVVENRFVRPPVSDFGDIQLESTGTVTLLAQDEQGKPITFPATIRLRGKNGDIYEPHTPSISERAKYEFHDIMPQEYQAFAIGTLPPPGAGDQITTPTIKNDSFVYTGEPLEQEITVIPGSPEDAASNAPPPQAVSKDQ